MDDRLNLGQITAQAMDLFYRDYATEDKFWNEINFKVNLVAYLGKLFNDDYDDRKSRNRNESGFSVSEFSSSWLIQEDVKVSKDEKLDVYYSTTSTPAIEFKFDAMASGIHSVEAIGKYGCAGGDILRLSNKDTWKIKRLPTTCNIYWWGMSGRVVFSEANSMPEKVRITFMPEITINSDCAVIPVAYVTMLITTVLQQMFGAKNEMKVVDKTNDGNPNTLEQTEVNFDNIKS